MDINKKNKDLGIRGQTAVETVLVLLLFIGLMFFVIEGARAMWILNSVNNAARIGARVAAVEDGLVEISAVGCGSSNTGEAFRAVCGVPEARANGANANGIMDEWVVTIKITENPPVEALVDEGDTVEVTVSTPFWLLAPAWGLGNITEISSVASMRYE